MGETLNLEIWVVPVLVANGCGRAMTRVHNRISRKGQKPLSDAGHQHAMIPTWQIAASDAVLEESIAGEQHPFLRQIESYVAW